MSPSSPVYQDNPISPPLIDKPLTLGVVSGKSLIQVIKHFHCQVCEFLPAETGKKILVAEANYMRICAEMSNITNNKSTSHQQRRWGC